jgi:hypothetical protein
MQQLKFLLCLFLFVPLKDFNVVALKLNTFFITAPGTSPEGLSMYTFYSLMKYRSQSIDCRRPEGPKYNSPL